jgi:hypothetical protein
MFVFQGSQFLIICLDRTRWDDDKTVRVSPGWGDSWFHTLVLWRQWRGGNRRHSEGEVWTTGSCTVYNSLIMHLCLLTRTSYSIFKCSRWEAVHVSGSCTTWFWSQSFCSSRYKDPTNVRKRHDISTLADVWARTFDTKTTLGVWLLKYCSCKVDVILSPKMKRTTMNWV